MKLTYPENFRKKMLDVTTVAKEFELSDFFKSLSSNRLSKEYELGKDWIVGPFENVNELTYTLTEQWKDPLNIGWNCTAIHNCSLLPHDGKLFMFYRANPSMESLSSRIGIAVYEEGLGWKDYAGNPIIYSTLDNENLSCDDPKVYKVDDKFVMFYQACYTPTQDDLSMYFDSNYPVKEVAVDINVAISYDLYHWEKKGPILSKQMSHLWAKAAVVPKTPDGQAIKINGKYIMYISEGCGGKQVIGYSEDMLNWDFEYQEFLDTSSIGQLYEVACSISDFNENSNIVLDFFYNDGTEICRAGQALYHRSEPAKQLDINRGGTLSWGGMIKYRDKWLYAQGWDAPYRMPVMFFYQSMK